MPILQQYFYYSDDLMEWVGPSYSINLVLAALKGTIEKSTKIWYSNLCPNKEVLPSNCHHTDRAVQAFELYFLPQFLFKIKTKEQDKKLMTITMLQALNGDCFLINIEGNEPCNILIDTGYEQTYKNQLRPLLQDISEREEALDLCIITHIDNDHIAGAIPLFKQNGYQNTSKVISINEVWHNSFRQINKTGIQERLNEKNRKRLLTIQRNAKAIIENPNATEQNISARDGSTLAALLLKGAYNWNLATDGDSISTETIPIHHLNDEVNLTLLSPDASGLLKLEKWWKKELFKAGYTSDVFNDETIFDDATEFLSRIPDYQEEGEETVSLTGAIEKEIQNALSKKYKKDNSPRNGSSIAFILENSNKKALFLGDAFSETIISNLKKKYTDEKIHFDVIKVSHHGSIRNNSVELWEMIDAPIYLISTNGSGHHHPDLKTLALIITRHSEYKRQLIFNYKTLVSEKFDDEDLKEKYNFEISYDTTIKI